MAQPSLAGTPAFFHAPLRSDHPAQGLPGGSRFRRPPVPIDRVFVESGRRIDAWRMLALPPAGDDATRTAHDSRTSRVPFVVSYSSRRLWIAVRRWRGCFIPGRPSRPPIVPRCCPPLATIVNFRPRPASEMRVWSRVAGRDPRRITDARHLLFTDGRDLSVYHRPRLALVWGTAGWRDLNHSAAGLRKHLSWNRALNCPARGGL
jgi:hypothetical protein